MSGRSAVARGVRRHEAQETARHARGALGGGALLLLVGLGMVGVGPSNTGMALALLALVVLIYGIHTFGRLGPDTGTSPPAR